MARTYAVGWWTLLLLASSAAAQPKQPRLDLYGDALPEGALLRIGSLRLQTGGVIGDLTFSRDGKQILAASRRTGVFVWDVATGKQLRHLAPNRPDSSFEDEPRAQEGYFRGRILSPGGTHVAETDKRGHLFLRVAATGVAIKLHLEGWGWDTDGPVRRVEFLPSGKVLATMGLDVEGRVELSEVATGKRLPSQAVVRLSPGGTHVGEVNKRGTMSLRDVATGSRIKLDKIMWDVARAVQFSPSGKNLAVMDSATSAVHVYEVATGKLLQSQAFPFQRDTLGPVIGIAPDDCTVTLVSLGDSIHLYDAKAGKRLLLDRAGSRKTAFSPDGKLLAVPSGKWVHVLELATGKHLALEAQGDDLRFTADGRRIVVLTSLGGVVKVFEAATGRLLQTATEGGWLESIAVSPDGTYLAGAENARYGAATIAPGAAVRLWHAATGKAVHSFANPPATHLTVKFAPDGKSITALGHPRDPSRRTGAWQWNSRNGKLLQSVEWAEDGENCPTGTISADGRVLARTKVSEQLLVSEVAARKVLLQVDATAHHRSRLVLSPDARSLLANCWYQPDTSHMYYGFHLWDVPAGKQLLATEWRENGYCDGYFDGSGRILVVLWRPQSKKIPPYVTCYEAATGRKLPRGTLPLTPAPEPWIESRDHPMISPDGRLLAEPPEYRGPVRVRELATGQLVGSLPDRGHVLSPPLAAEFCNNDRLAFSPNGRLLAAATNAGAILVWDMATSAVVAERTGHRGAVMSLSWARDGKRLVSSGQDMTLLVWDAAPWWARVEMAAQSLPPPALQTLWRDLASDRAEQGYKAVWQLVRAPKQALTLLCQHLPGAGSKAAAKVRALLADLDSAKFAVRERAYAELEKLGDLAVPGLEKALAGSLEVRKRAEKLLQTLDQRPLPAAVLQQMRALKVLETLGTVEARALLQELANEDALAWLTREAKLVLARCR